MKADIDYIKRILEAFEASPDPIVGIRWLDEQGLDHNSKEFLFNLHHLNDLHVIEREDGKPGFGFNRGADWSGGWSIVPLRMTAQGSEFLAALRNKSILAILKKDFKEEGIKTLIDVSKRLVEGYANKELDAILNN